MGDFYKSITKRELDNNDDFCRYLNQLLNEDLIHKINKQELKCIILKHSNILNHIINNKDLADDIKNRLINRIIIEEKFKDHIIKRLKFKLSNLNEEDYRFSLSSTTICSYAITQYMDLWNENHKFIKQKLVIWKVIIYIYY